MLIALSFRFFGRIKPALTTSVLILFGVPMLLRLMYCTSVAFDAGMRKVVIFRLDALMWGVALAAMHRHRSGWFKRLASPLWLPLGMFCLAEPSWWVWTHFQKSYAFRANLAGACVFTLASFGAALILPWFASIRLRKSLINRCAYLISVWSYSVYLCHPIVISRVKLFFADPELNNPAVLTMAWLTTFAVAAGIYYGFERPILKWRDRLGRSNLAGIPAVLAGNTAGA